MWSNYMMGGSWWGMGLSMGLFWLLVLAAFVALVLSVTRRHKSAPAEISSRKTARMLLEERYARGEIGRNEFEQKKRDLQR